MKNAPNLWTMKELFDSAGSVAAKINGKYVPARPLGFDSMLNRFRIAWEVFTGRADAVTWPEGQ